MSRENDGKRDIEGVQKKSQRLAIREYLMRRHVDLLAVCFL